MKWITCVTVKGVKHIYYGAPSVNLVKQTLTVLDDEGDEVDAWGLDEIDTISFFKEEDMVVPQ